MEKDTRPWGNYEVLLDDEDCKVKKITIKPKSRPSYQYHHKRSEIWIMVSGHGQVTLDDKERFVTSGDIIEVPIECRHRIENQDESKNLVFIEIQQGTYFGEDDIVRVSDDYDRC